MGRLDHLNGARVYIDTSVFVYATEFLPDDASDPKLAAAIESSRQAVSGIEAGEFVAVTSELTLLEVLVGPLKKKMTALADFYRAELSSGGLIDMQAVERKVLDDAACLRATIGLKTADAIHLATAVHSKCSALVSNDKKLAASANTAGIEGIYLGQGDNDQNGGSD